MPTLQEVTGAGTTSVPAEWTTVHVHVDPRAAAFGIRVVGVRSHRVVELDTVTGQLAELDTQTRYDEPPQVDAGPDWFLVRRPDTSFSQLFRGREQPVPIHTGDAGEVFVEPGTDRFWRAISPSESLAPSRVVELDHLGHETGVAF